MNDEEPGKTVDQTMKQIYERGYTSKYKKMGFEVIPIGIAFYGIVKSSDEVRG